MEYVEETIEEREKKRTEEYKQKFETQPEAVQRDCLYLEYVAEKSKKSIEEKMKFGQKIPDDLLDDIKTYYENYNAILKLIGIDPKSWND